MDRKIFDCSESIAIAYPGIGRGQNMQGKVHLSPVPRPGVALSHGIHIEGTRALTQLRSAVDHALGQVQTNNRIAEAAAKIIKLEEQVGLPSGYESVFDELRSALLGSTS